MSKEKEVYKMNFKNIFKIFSNQKDEPTLEPQDEFYVNHHDYIADLDASISSYIRRYQASSNIDEEIFILQRFIPYYHEKRNETKTLGNEFQQYFDEMYEHCHNSREKDFSMITYYEERLDYLKQHYEEEKEKEQKLVTLHDDILLLLKENDGILQKDFCKLFNSNIRDDVRRELYYDEKNGLVSRE